MTVDLDVWVGRLRAVVDDNVDDNPLEEELYVCASHLMCDQAGSEVPLQKWAHRSRRACHRSGEEQI